MNEALNNLLTRRSCRAYKAEPIRQEELEAILEAGTYAPTSMGQQSPFIVATQDPELIARIERLNAAVLGDPDAKPFYGAPALAIVFGDPTTSVGIPDGNLVMANLLNAANAVGVDSCYIWRAKEVFNTEEGKALKAAWSIPDHYEGIGNVILGYGKPEGKGAPAPRKEGYARIV